MDSAYIPFDCIFNICQYLQTRDILSIAATCEYMYEQALSTKLLLSIGSVNVGREYFPALIPYTHSIYFKKGTKEYKNAISKVTYIEDRNFVSLYTLIMAHVYYETLKMKVNTTFTQFDKLGKVNSSRNWNISHMYERLFFDKSWSEGNKMHELNQKSKSDPSYYFYEKMRFFYYQYEDNMEEHATIKRSMFQRRIPLDHKANIKMIDIRNTDIKSLYSHLKSLVGPTLVYFGMGENRYCNAKYYIEATKLLTPLKKYSETLLKIDPNAVFYGKNGKEFEKITPKWIENIVVVGRHTDLGSIFYKNNIYQKDVIFYSYMRMLDHKAIIKSCVLKDYIKYLGIKSVNVCAQKHKVQDFNSILSVNASDEERVVIIYGRKTKVSKSISWILSRNGLRTLTVMDIIQWNK